MFSGWGWEGLSANVHKGIFLSDRDFIFIFYFFSDRDFNIGGGIHFPAVCICRHWSDMIGRRIFSLRTFSVLTTP